MKRILIFGSTGSIGKNTLSVIRQSQNKFKVVGLCVNRDINTLYRQIKEFRPSFICVSDEGQAKKLKKHLKRSIKLFSGKNGLREFSTLTSDISVMAISGISCLKPLLINMQHTKRIALANKESLVTGGSLVFGESRKYNTQILPVDSEINALFQLLTAKNNFLKIKAGLRKVYLTASGGALAGYKKKDLSKVRVKQVLAHPTWDMGRRITVDSATLINKGFEVVETHLFFGLPYERIDIIIHKESAVHALIEYNDGTLFACLYPPDMKMPISFALSYPQRQKSGPKINFKNRFSYTFSPLHYNNYPLLKMILQAAKKKDNSLVVLNACDEVAIDYFLRGKIGFMDIYKVMAYIFQHYHSQSIKSLEDIFYWDNWARRKTEERLKKL